MKQLEKLMNNQEERIYTIGDLENLSASRLYGFDPSRPLGSFSISPISQPSFPNLSHQFSYLDSYGKKEKEKPSQNKYDPLNFLSKKSEPLSFASNFGLSLGVAKETQWGYIERYLPPHVDETHGEHINLGSYLPRSKKPFLNIHIDLNDDKKK